MADSPSTFVSVSSRRYGRESVRLTHPIVALVKAMAEAHGGPLELFLDTGGHWHEYQVLRDGAGYWAPGVGRYETLGEAVAACVGDHEGLL